MSDEEITRLWNENLQLRSMLAHRCAPNLYADDGELQDSSVHPLIDYKRDSVEVIRDKWMQRAKATLATPMPPEPIRKDLVLVPRELIDAAKNLISVKGRHHTELAYKQLCQALVNCEGE